MILTDYVMKKYIHCNLKKMLSFKMVLYVGKARNEKREFQQSLSQIFTNRPPLRAPCGKEKEQRVIIH